MSVRRGPSVGYDVGMKRQYRRNVWSELSRLCPVPMAEARILILPSAEGDEIETAKANGAREQNIHICDSNPAIVATLKRRFPRCVGHGISLKRVIEERCEGLDYHLINADLCGTAQSAFREAELLPAVVARSGAFAVTWLKGRDPEMAALARRGGLSRVDWLDDAFNTVRMITGTVVDPTESWIVTRRRQENYRTHVSPMEWAAWKCLEARRPLQLDAVALAKAFRGARQSPILSKRIEILERALRERVAGQSVGPA